MRIHLCSIVLILISASVAASHLSPPVNVSIDCDTYGVEVRWEYPGPRRDVLFRVEVNAHVNHKENSKPSVTTQNLRVNISNMLFHSGHNTYYVTVTAERGGQSSASTSPQFSFNENSNKDVLKCRLDFPKVELSAKDGMLHMQFINPLQLYKDTPALSNLSQDYDLEYEVKTEELNFTTNCEMRFYTCETFINFSEHRDIYCINVSGSIEQRELNPTSGCFTGNLRVSSDPEITVYIYPLLGVCVTIGVITIIFLLLAKKCNKEIKKTIPALPSPLVENHKAKFKPLKLDIESIERNLKVQPNTEPTDETTLVEHNTEEEEEEEEQEEQEQTSGSKDLEDSASEKESPYRDNELSDSELDELGEGYEFGHGLEV